jgi:DNA repair/transcription protein MET18/MMS19
MSTRKVQIQTRMKENDDLTDRIVDQDFISPLIQHKERFFGIFESSLMASNEYNLLRLSGLDGIKLMVLSKNYLEPNEVGLAVQSFNKILMNEVEDMDLRKAALNALYVTAHVYSLYIVEETLPALMDKLPENSNVRKDSYALTALRVLCPIASVYTHGMPLLLQKLDAICQQGQRVDDAQEIASVILNILQAKENDHEQLVQEIHTMVPYIFRKTIEASLNTAQPSLYLDTNLLQTLSLVIITIFTKVDSSSQKGFVDALFKSFIQSDLSDLLHVEGQFKPLNPSSPEAQQKTVCLFAAIICSLRKDVVLPISSMEDYLNEMVTLALSSPIQVTSVSRMIGSLINKWKDDAALTEYVKTTTLLLQDTVTQNPYALEVYLWITKSLVLRAHPLGYALTDQLIAWCGDNSMQGVPQGFDILIGDDPFALNKPMFTTVTILYKQRFFSYSLPKLIQGYENAQEEIKSNYLIALSFVLKNVPKQILLNELPPLVPLLIQSLGLSDTSLKVSTLSTFRLAVTEAPQVISNQVNAILPSLLNILQDPSNPIQVRVAVLGCLSEFPVFLSKEIVKPHSLLVLSKLKIPLDDRKRIVRKEAVDCRSKWFAIL